MRRTIRMESPIGALYLSSEDGLLCDVTLTPSDITEADDILLETETQLSEYFQGARRDFSLPFKLSGSAFQQDVLRGMLSVPYGRTISYRELAVRAGHDKALRAVGSACGRNRILIIIPCHRITASHGIGGFSSGLEVKKKLLELEKVKGVNDQLPTRQAAGFAGDTADPDCLVSALRVLRCLGRYTLSET